MIETNRQRLERLGMMDDETIEELTEDIRCDYCEWTRKYGRCVFYGPNGPIMCEGNRCDEAIEEWLDDEAEEYDKP